MDKFSKVLNKCSPHSNTAKFGLSLLDHCKSKPLGWN